MGDAVAVDLKFDGLQDYSTGEPSRLRAELQRQNAKVLSAFVRAGQKLEALPVERVATGTVQAAFGEAVLCDTTNANITIEAPEILPGDAGKAIDVVHVRPGNSIIFRARPPQLVQGTVSVTFTTVGYWRIRAYGGNWLVQQ